MLKEDGLAKPDLKGTAFAWKELPSFPPNRVQWSAAIPNGDPDWTQIGLGGPICGVHGDYLVVAGGTNFPEPGLTVTRANTLGKVYWDEVFILNLKTQHWSTAKLRLPQALAYAATVSLSEGVLIIGGEGFASPTGSASKPPDVSSDVMLLHVGAEGNHIQFTKYPSLPWGMSNTAAARVGDLVIVQGARGVLQLDLKNLNRGWEAVVGHPLGDRTSAIAAGIGKKAIFATGRPSQPETSILKDVHAFDVETKQWSTRAPMLKGAIAGLGFGLDNRWFVVVGGEGNDERVERYRQLELQRNKAGHGTPVWEALTTKMTFLHDHHTGFNPEIQVYDAELDCWHYAGHLPASAPVTTQPVQWKDQILLVSGEVGPGKRTPKIWAGSVRRG